MSVTVNELARKYPAASEYITQIYLILRDYSYCNNRRLASHIGVSPSAVSQAVSRLKKLNLAEQDKYGMITLMPPGVKLGEKILHRHYLLELLMVKTLGFPWELADKEAENLQDKVSEEFLIHLDKRLGHPQVCPHGNPMPGNPEAEALIHAPRLTKLKKGDWITIVRITEEGERIPGLLHLCYEFGVMPGQEYCITLITKEAIHLLRKGLESPSSMPVAFAEHICVKSVKTD
ncbi:MAG: metal-dependent transcriptional regulator [Spirochaetales bacterium]|jgi:DtxR family Mn-dependent transcriptional regulator|nr:metal-dependent transcriptional regulator [Spirochaetales bacterium]